MKKSLVQLVHVTALPKIERLKFDFLVLTYSSTSLESTCNFSQVSRYFLALALALKGQNYSATALDTTIIFFFKTKYAYAFNYQR